MAISKEFIPHTELKASDLNELVTQVNGYTAETKAALQAAIASSTSGIERQATQSEEDALVFTTDGGVEVGKIDSTGADFTNLKRGGQQVARISDLPTVPTLDTSIGSSPSNSHTPSTKAVKDYVDGKQIDLPITKETTQSEAEEQVWRNDAETQEYAKVGPYGMKSKAYLDMQGNNVIPVKDSEIDETTPSQTNLPTSKAVADYVSAHGVGNLPISQSQTYDESKKIQFTDDNNNPFMECSNEGMKINDLHTLDGKKYLTEDNSASVAGEKIHAKGALGFNLAPDILTGDYDYLLLFGYGQSYSITQDGGYSITQTPYDENIFFLGSAMSSTTGQSAQSIQTSPNRGSDLICVDTADIFSRLIKKYTCKKPNIIVNCQGIGGTTILELMKNNGLADYNYYEDNVTVFLTHLKEWREANNLKILCPFIFYLQGESDTESGYNSHGERCANGDLSVYKSRLATMKEDLQTDIMWATGQTEAPIMLIDNIGNKRFNDKLSGISQAQTDFTRDNPDVYTLGSYYAYPSYGSHPTPDGRRWIAERAAKQLYNIFMGCRKSQMYIQGYRLSGNSVVLEVNCDVLPLVVDSYTSPSQTNLGFTAYTVANETLIPIKSVNVGSTSIEIEFTQLPQESFYIVYAGKNTDGYGNIRDSDEWQPKYKYASNALGNMSSIAWYPKDENGNDIIGEYYPMWNWLPASRVLVQIS